MKTQEYKDKTCQFQWMCSGKRWRGGFFLLRKYSEINNIISIITKKCLRIDNKRYKKTDYKINPEGEKLRESWIKRLFPLLMINCFKWLNGYNINTNARVQ
jgi:hypothetical protein